MKRAFFTLLYILYSLPWRITRPITLGVRVLLIEDGKVLLVKHSYQPGWYLPGGKVERRETPEQSALRECHEEAGTDVETLTLFGVFTQFVEGKNDHIIVFLGEGLSSVPPRRDFEIEARGFFPLDALPPDIRPGSLARIEEYLRGEPRPKAGFW